MSRRGVMLFLVMAVLWGVPYLFIRIAVRDLDPFVVVEGRVLLGAAALAPWALRPGRLAALRPHLGWVLLFAVIEMAGPFVLIGVAERSISSGTAGLLIATVPLLSAGLGLVLGREGRLSARRLIGLVVGLAGVGLLVGLDMRGARLWAVAAVLLAAVGYAVGALLMSTRLAGLPSDAVTAASLAAAGAVLAPWAWIARPTAPVGIGAWAAVAALGLVCSAAAFLVFFQLIAEVGAARSTVITYLNPVVAIALGLVILGEPLTWGTAAGFPLVVLGSVLATGRDGRRHDVPEEARVTEPSLTAPRARD